MTNDVSMSEKKEDTKVGVACPLCLKRGKQSKVKLFQINYSEALVSCEDSQCPFPLLEGHLTNIVRRDFRGVKAEVPVPNISAADSLSDNSVCGSESSSQKSASIIENVDESRGVSHSDVSATTNSTAVINTSASSSEVLTNVNKFDKFEFTATVPAQKEIRKKPKKKYYVGCRKRKSYKKPNSRTQNMGVTCPLCFKRGIQSEIKLFQRNMEALILCANDKCNFPVLKVYLTNINMSENYKASAPNLSREDSGSDYQIYRSARIGQIQSIFKEEVRPQNVNKINELSTNMVATIELSESSSEDTLQKGYLTSQQKCCSITSQYDEDTKRDITKTKSQFFGINLFGLVTPQMVFYDLWKI
ncbi:hypothetical protein R5R35_004852 [Gryllus longicercus]|uniref:Uncharacterized protein n=1 Tax=Gryllus longicercus TaxID=2509291 RepID=A0AAN9VF16_9ORTH